LLSRNAPVSRAQAARNRGPSCPPTPAGKAPQVVTPHPAHRRRWRRYSVTTGVTGGTSDLVPQRGRVAARQRPAASPAGGRRTVKDVVGVADERPLGLRVPGLAAGRLARRRLGRRALDGRRVARRRLGRVARVLVEPGFEVGDPGLEGRVLGQKRLDERRHGRRQGGEQFRWQRGRNVHVAEESMRPTTTRLQRVVNDYAGCTPRHFLQFLR